MRPFARLAHDVLKDERLTPIACKVYATLDQRLNKKTGDCVASTAYIAAWCKCDRRTVLRALKLLEATGYIQVKRSSGRPNEFVLVPTVTGDTVVTGSNPVTGDTVVTPTRDTGVTGQVDFYRIEVLRTEEKEQAAAPFHADDVSLFDNHQRHWLFKAINQCLGECPELADAAWTVGPIAEFFLSRRWLKREDDPPYAITWVRRFAAIGATEHEVNAAFRWASTTRLTDGQGRDVFDRPTYLNRIAFWIESHRKRPTNAVDEQTPAPPCKAELLWTQATEADRERIRAKVRRLEPPDRDPNGLVFRTHCWHEYQREIETNEPADAPAGAAAFPGCAQ